MSDIVVGAKLEADSSGAVTSVKSFREQLKQAQQDVVLLSAKFGDTSKEAANAAKRAAELKDQIEDAKSLTDAFNPDTKFRAFGASINTVVGGFTALQGIIALTGEESKVVEKAMVKLQAAMALSQGISQLQEGIQSFKNLGSVIQQSTVFQKANAAATALTSTVMRAFGVNVVATSTAFNVLKGAIIATGIGALVIGITAAVQALGIFKDKTADAADEQERLRKEIESTNYALSAGQQFLKNEERIEIARAKLKGKSEEEIFKIQQKYRDLNLKSLDRAYNEIKGKDAMAADELLQQIKNAQTDKEVAEYEHQLKMLNIRKDAAEKARKQAEADRKEEVDRLGRVAARDSLNQVGGIKIEIPKSAEQQQIENAVAAAHLALEQKKGIWQEESDIKSKIYTDDKDAANEQMLTDRALAESKRALADATLGALGAVADLVGRQTKLGKIIALAEIAHGTATGFISALRIAQKSAEGTGPAAVFTYPIFFATQLAAVLGAANKAKAILGGGGQSITAPAAATAPLVPERAERATTTLDQASLAAIGNATTRAFFLESDFDDRERIVRLNRMARLGD